jgi:16S rRNA C967 or C1407 C5-methylase (RsmB/RsmF family)
MLTEMYRFVTAAQVRKEARVPKELWATILPLLPVVHERADGTSIHYEGEVDEVLTDHFRRQHDLDAPRRAAPKGTQGRKDTTREIAEYANQLKPGKTWKEVLAACKKRWPNDPRVDNVDQVRGTWGRHFGSKKKKAN